MVDKTKLHDRILEIAIQRGIIQPSSEIYGSVAGLYDYGTVGTAIRRKIINIWREIFITKPGFLEIESSIILPKSVLVASGHANSFTDPVVEDILTKKRYRADHLLEQKTKTSWEGKTADELNTALKEHKIRAPDTKNNLTDVLDVNLMFSTTAGVANETNAYLRPETAQGIFLNFKRIFAQNGSKLPIAIGQVGKSFRNEIAPRQGLIRMREFTQMELEYFFNPDQDTYENFDMIEDKKIKIRPPNSKDMIDITLAQAVADKYFPNQIMASMIYFQDLFCKRLGLNENDYYFAVLPKDALPHYSRGNVDLEVITSYGAIECSGTAYRTDFDLKSHALHSKKDLSVKIADVKEKFIPHVIEPSLGVDRLFYSILEHCFREKSESKEWEWFAFPPAVAPYAVAVFPLMKKDGLPEIAKQIVEKLRDAGIDCYYSKTGSIGKRYARADEIGIPYAITVDYESKENDDTTVRFRDDGGQVRIAIDQLAVKLAELIKESKTSLK